jgi:hypothetical protein
METLSLPQQRLAGLARAVRAALTVPALFALTLLVIEQPQTAGFVKGFRTPARHRRERRTEAGVRKASREETAGGVRAGGGVRLWGFSAGGRSDVSVSHRNDG